MDNLIALDYMDNLIAKEISGSRLFSLYLFIYYIKCFMCTVYYVNTVVAKWNVIGSKKLLSNILSIF